MRAERSPSVLMMCLIAYLLSPVAYYFWLEYELARGAFPIDADSIGLPMFGFLILWGSGLIAGAVLAITLIVSKLAARR